MMGELIRIGDEIEPRLRAFFGGSWFSRSIRGVLLDVDDYWEFTELGEELGHRFYYEYLTDSWHELSLYRLFFQAQSLSKYYRPMMDFRPHWWDDHCRAMQYPRSAKPVVIRVVLKEKSPVETVDLPRNCEGDPIVYEFRPPNRAVTMLGPTEWLAQVLGWVKGAGKAPSIGRADPNTAGTLGGILGGADPRTKCLVTCAHVLGPPGTEVYQPGPFEGKKSQLIGAVRISMKTET
jgi:hypothetical protein